MKQRWAPSLTLVGGLIGIAALVGLILWATLGTGGESTTTTTVLPANPATPVTVGAETSTDVGASDNATDNATDVAPAASGAATIIGITSFDPDGDDGDENSDIAENAIADADTSTTWRTSCYSNQFMGAKRGVGLIVSFDQPVDRPLAFDVVNGPYQVQMYEWDGDTAPSTLDGWGEPFDRSFGPQGETVVTDASGFAARHVLLLLNEIGEDSGCSANNPYRGTIDEVTLVN